VERQRDAKKELLGITAHGKIIRLSTVHNPFTHVEHVAQDVEWNIDCVKPVLV